VTPIVKETCISSVVRGDCDDREVEDENEEVVEEGDTGLFPM
jgi:hypothetical protein